VHYDAMLAKVIATAETRALATQRLAAALRAFPVLGIRTNIAFLIRVLESEMFASGRIHTGYLDSDGASLASPDPVAPPDFLRAVLDAHTDEAPRTGAPGGAYRDPWDGPANGGAR
jgi:propionyl-CoA carboxylase alpha chain